MFLFVFGKDRYRVRRHADDLLEKFFEKYDPQRLNGERVFCKDLSREEIVLRIQAAPFLAQKRYVVLFGLLDEVKKADLPFWQEALLRKDIETVLCFVEYEDKKALEKMPLVAWMAGDISRDRQKMFPIEELTSQERKAWVQARMQALGSSCSPEVAQMLIDRVGTETELLAHEIEKLSAYARGGACTTEMCERLSPRTITGDFFGLMDASTQDTPASFLNRLEREFSSGSDGYALLGGFLRHARVLLEVVKLSQEKNSPQDIAKILDIHPFVVQKALTSAKFIDIHRLESAYAEVCSWDLSAKYGGDADILARRLAALFLSIRKAS